MNPEDQLVLVVALVWLLALTLFALPALIAFRRGDPNRWLILVCNVSFVGWVVAMAVAVYPIFLWRQPPDSDD